MLNDFNRVHILRACEERDTVIEGYDCRKYDGDADRDNQLPFSS